MTEITLSDFASYGILPLLALAVVLVFIRLVHGPSLPDRIMALDLMNTLGIGIIATYAITTDQAAFLDVAIAMALISFVGTVGFAYYIERRV
jgi:multicomponent Na+:H+ antiporter subunit F